MQQRKFLILFFGIVSIVFSLNAISSTFAKYSSSTKSNAKLNIARWDIVVNDNHIKDNDSKETLITPNYIDNPNVAAGVIAPGSVGYFDLVIDGSYTDVSFDFDINILPNDNSNVSDLRLMKYYVDTVDNIQDGNEESIISSSIDINDENKIKTVRIYIIWDDINGIMNNEEDSIVGHNSNNSDASVLVKINFKQKI